MAPSRPNRPARGAVAAVIASSVLAGCGSGGHSASSTTVARTAPAATVRLGFMGGLTGPSAYLGTSIFDGEKLAVSQFDAVDPQVTVEIDSVDTGGDPARARSGAAKLAADRVVAVIGPTSGSEVAVAGAVMEQAGIPSVTVSAAESDLAARGWRFFHRVIPDDGLQGQAVGDFVVKNLHAATVAVIDDSSVPSRDLAVSAAEAATGAGATVVSTEHLDGRPADLTAVAGRFVGDQPGAVFFAGSSVTAARLASSLRAAGFAGKLLVGGSDTGGFVAAAGPSAAEGTYLACACAGTDQNPDAQAFNAAYLAQFGSNPGPYSAEAYDTTNAILQAIKLGDVTPAAVNGYLASADYSGITRTIRFLPDGDWVGSTVYLYRVESGHAVQVASSGQG